MGTTITWKKLANGDIEQTTVVAITRVKIIPAGDFNTSKLSIETAHQARADRIFRDNDHLAVMDGALLAKEGESVSIEYDDAGSAVISRDEVPTVK